MAARGAVPADDVRRRVDGFVDGHGVQQRTDARHCLGVMVRRAHGHLQDAPRRAVERGVRVVRGGSVRADAVHAKMSHTHPEP